MLLDSVAHFITFNLKSASVTRQLVPKSIVSHSFGSIDVDSTSCFRSRACLSLW